MALRARSRRPKPWTRWILPVFVVIVMFYLVTPILTVVLASLTETKFIKFPPQGLSLQWYETLFTGEKFWSSIVRSLLTAATAVIVSMLIGVPASYAMIRYRFRGRDLLNMATLAPIIIPEMIIAIALLQFFAAADVRASFPALAFGHTVLAVPFMIRAVSASLRGTDASLEEAGRGLGAPPLTAFFTITLPLIRPGLFAGSMFVFVISMDLFLVSMLLSEVQTLPVEIWWSLRFASEPTVLALASIMIALTVPTIMLLSKLVGLESFIGVGRA